MIKILTIWVMATNVTFLVPTNNDSYCRIYTNGGQFGIEEVRMSCDKVAELIKEQTNE